MLGKKDDSKEIKAFIGKDCKFEGKFFFKGTVKIDGIFEGDIISEKGILIVGETSEIKGLIEVGTLINKGKIEGDIKAEKIENFVPGSIIGNIEVNSLFIQNGSIFDGECKMVKHRDIEEISSSGGKIKKLEP